MSRARYEQAYEIGSLRSFHSPALAGCYKLVAEVCEVELPLKSREEQR